MKNTLLLFLLSIASGALSFAQNPALNDYTWYVYRLEVNGNLTERPNNPEMSIATSFDFGANTMVNTLCCAGSFQLDIIPGATNSTLQTTNFSNTPGTCNQNPNNSFATSFRAFFQNSPSLTYSIQQEAPETFQLLLEQANGDKVYFYNTPHLSGADAWLFDDDKVFLGEWFLEGIYIDDVYYDQQSLLDNEYGEITATFDYNGSFSTSVCDDLTGEFTVSENEFDVYFNCETLTTSNLPCNDPENTTLQEMYFQFFEDNSDAVLSVGYEIIDGYDGPCPITPFSLVAPSGDYLYFTNCSTLSNPKKRFSNSIKVYPNPVEAELYIDTAVSLEKITVYDLNGKLLLEQKNPQESVSLQALSSGVYFVKLTSPQNSLTKKVVKK